MFLHDLAHIMINAPSHFSIEEKSGQMSLKMALGHKNSFSFCPNFVPRVQFETLELHLHTDMHRINTVYYFMPVQFNYLCDPYKHGGIGRKKILLKLRKLVD